MRSSACGVVISYYPAATLRKNVDLLLAQTAHIFVVDNTPRAHVSDILNDLERIGCCTVIRNKRNLGIAAALNIGIREAIASGFDWIITFDQDSQVREDFVEAMFASYEQASRQCSVGITFPRYQDTRLGVFLPTHRAANGDVFACMTSGSMIRAETFQSFGVMDERLFIDYVDLDYCLRLRTAGLKVIESEKAVLSHSLGRLAIHHLLGKTFSVSNHSAKRRYYITRNRLVVIKRYLRRDREWALEDLKGMIVETAKILLVETDRLAKVGYMLRAVFDAMFNRLGPRVPL